MANLIKPLFFIALVLGSLLGCAKPQLTSNSPTDFPHDKEGWLGWRAQERQQDLASAKEADSQMGANNKPENYGANYLKVEGQALWAVHCATCHGLKGKGNPQGFDPAPRQFGGMGLKMGFFFGGDKMRAGIFHRIATGQSLKAPGPSAMPGFEGQLNNEQLWALVLHLENL